MGYIRHHAIIVTGGYDDFAVNAREQAKEIGLGVTPLVKSAVNGFESFLVVPDGSKEGWEESETGDIRRATFIRYLESLRYGDDSSPLSWVEVQYGDDAGETVVTRDSDEAYRQRAVIR